MSNSSKKNKRPTFKEWFFEGKGTVSEPWPTVKEILADEEVQKEIKKVRDVFDSYRKNQKK
ncbi:MAG: hypothetical protein ACR2M7_00350 [Bdellovibrionales bacterium]